MSDITQLSISDLRKGFKSKAFSAAELTKGLLLKIEKNKELNAFCHVCQEEATKAAVAADSNMHSLDFKPLLGIPGAIKDMILTKGIKSTAGSKMLANFVPPYSATVVNKLLDAGSTIIGKANLDEFAMGSSNENSAWGPVKNPWNLECVPGGSSGGSAAAVAACLAPYALGTDTGGSIRQPAALCSIVGIKPTYGRVSRYGVVAYASSLDQVGAMTRNVRDAATVTQVICGADSNDATSVAEPVPDFGASLGQSIKGLRVGIPKEYFIKGIDSNVEKLVRAAIAQLASLGAEIVEISLPHTEFALSVYYVIATAEASSNLARYDGVRYGHRAKDIKDLNDLYCRSRSEGFGPEIKRRIMMGTYVLSSGYYDAYYLRAQKVRTLLAKDFSDAFESHCDLIACPVSPTPAFKIGAKVSNPLEMYLSDVFTLPLNLAGLPGMSIPCGFDPSGLPVGFQLIGKQWDEATLFKVGYAYEQSTDWHTKLAPLAKS